MFAFLNVYVLNVYIVNCVYVADYCIFGRGLINSSEYSQQQDGVRGNDAK